MKLLIFFSPCILLVFLKLACPPGAAAAGAAGAAGAEEEEDAPADLPLQLSDIMPKDRRLYDKMRPPKYKGT